MRQRKAFMSLNLGKSFAFHIFHVQQPAQFTIMQSVYAFMQSELKLKMMFSTSSEWCIICFATVAATTILE